jgi:DNA polymerase-3 subunit gamma/tau
VSTSETLALKYRPRTLSDVVGQKSVRMILAQMVRDDKVPTGLLFSGVRGTGKTTTGRILAAALNCSGEAHPPCGQCVHCKAIYVGNSLDVYEIDAASNGRVADINLLVEQLRYSVGGAYRVVLLDEAHSMTREAFNALLKTLEEPPPQTVFILLTTEPGKILDTVLSRLMNFEFRRISSADIIERLRYICDQECFSVEPELLLTIADRSNGGLRDAVMTLDQVTRVGVKTVSDFSELLGETDYGPDLVQAMQSGDPVRVFASLDEQLTRTGDASAISTQLIHTLRDVMVIHGGGEIPRQGAALESRRRAAAQSSPDKVMAALRVLWDLKTKVRAGEDPRTMLDLAAVMVTEALAGRTRVAAQASAAPARKLSLSEMRSRQ